MHPFEDIQNLDMVRNGNEFEDILRLLLPEHKTDFKSCFVPLCNVSSSVMAHKSI